MAKAQPMVITVRHVSGGLAVSAGFISGIVFVHLLQLLKVVM